MQLWLLLCVVCICRMRAFVRNFQIGFRSSLIVFSGCNSFFFSYRWSKILTLLTSSLSPADLVEEEDLLDDALVSIETGDAVVEVEGFETNVNDSV